MDKPTSYHIEVKGHLDDTWSEWFEGLTIANQEDGNAIISGDLQDQAELQGVLGRITSLGLALISVNAVSDKDHLDHKEK